MIALDPNVGQYLKQAFGRGLATHAYIVVGEKQYVKSLLKECALVTMCRNHVVDECDSCKKVMLGEHLDVISLPIDVSKNKLTVGDVAYLVEESYRRPVDNSEQRTFLVDATDSVSGVGCELWQNKLLKTLEEPIEGVYIFIGVTDAEALLPTVRSRCQILKQSRFSVSEAKRVLSEKSFDLTSCEIAAVMSGGNVQLGERILANRSAFEAYRLAIDIATEMTSTKVALKYASALLAQRENINDCLGFLTALLRESIVYRLAPELCQLSRLQNTIDKICSNYTLAAAENCIEIINKAKKQLDDGANVTVVTDRLLNKLLETRYLCRK